MKGGREAILREQKPWSKLAASWQLPITVGGLVKA